MPDESPNPGLVEFIHELVESTNRRDVHALVSRYAPDAVLDISHWEMGIYEGPAAIRRVFTHWMDVYEDVEIGADEVLALGSGVVLAVFRESGRPSGRDERVRVRVAWIYEWAEGLIVRATAFRDIDEARVAARQAAAERVTAERAAARRAAAPRG